MWFEGKPVLDLRGHLGKSKQKTGTFEERSVKLYETNQQNHARNITCQFEVLFLAFNP